MIQIKDRYLETSLVLTDDILSFMKEFFNKDEVQFCLENKLFKSLFIRWDDFCKNKLLRFTLPIFLLYCKVDFRPYIDIKDVSSCLSWIFTPFVKQFLVSYDMEDNSYSSKEVINYAH